MSSQRSSTVLVVIAVAGSALAWWPLCIDPNLDLPFWVPLLIIAWLAALSTILSGGRWLRFAVASSLATFAGIYTGSVIWLPKDPIAASYTPIVVLVATLAAALVSLLAGLAVRWLPISSGLSLRRALWIACIACAASGPVALALTPPLVARRVANNDRLAEQRFLSLKRAVEQTVAESGGPARLCDGKSLRARYSGPAFSDRDWHYIAGNYVRVDGYEFGIWVYCPDPHAYLVDVAPAHGKADGSRRFCADEGGAIGCGMEWTPSRGESCTPCPK